MRQPGPTAHKSTSEPAMSSKDLLLHSIKEEDDARSLRSGGASAAGCTEGSAGGNCSNAAPKQASSLSSASTSGVLDLLTKGPLHPATAAKLQGLVAARGSGTAAAAAAAAATDEGEDASGAPVDIGLKVANEIIGLHSQAAAAGRALAHSTRHAELVADENKRLKEDIKKARQAQHALEDELTRIKSKLSQRSIEMLMQEQKVQAAEELAEANAQKAAESQANVTAVNERYDALVMRVMVVAVKAAVAADDLDKALRDAQAMRGMGCGCKPALLHGIEVLSAMVSFRDTWRAGPGTPRGSNRPSTSSTTAQRTSAAGTTSAAAGAAAAAAGPQSPRIPMSPRSYSRSMLGKDAGKSRAPPATSKLPMNRPGGATRPSSAGDTSRNLYPRASNAGDISRKPGFTRPSSAGDVSRYSIARTSSAGDFGRQGFARPSSAGERRSPEVMRTNVVRPSSACDVRSSIALARTNKQLATLEQQLQCLQEQRQAQPASYRPPVRSTSRSRSMCSSRESSPGRGRSLAGVPSADTLRAAASQMLNAIALQKQQMRPSTVSSERATAPRVGISSSRRVSSSSAASMPAVGRRVSSSTSPPPAWNSGPGPHKRHVVSSNGQSAATSPRRATYDDGDTYYGSPSQQSYRAYADTMCDPRESEPHYEQAVQYTRRVYEGGVLYTS